MTTTKRLSDKRIISRRTFIVRHDCGDLFEVQARTLARLRRLIKAECQKRGWRLQDDVDWWELESPESHIASLRNFENMGNVIKHAHKEAKREKTANFWRREEW